MEIIWILQDIFIPSEIQFIVQVFFSLFVVTSACKQICFPVGQMNKTILVYYARKINIFEKSVFFQFVKGDRITG